MLTKKQAMEATEFHIEGECTRIIGPRGSVKEKSVVWRKNGSVKTWVTRPDEFRVPVKYGMYSFGYITRSTANSVHVPEDCPLNDPNFVTEDNRIIKAKLAEPVCLGEPSMKPVARYLVDGKPFEVFYVGSNSYRVATGDIWKVCRVRQETSYIEVLKLFLREIDWEDYGHIQEIPLVDLPEGPKRQAPDAKYRFPKGEL